MCQKDTVVVVHGYHELKKYKCTRVLSVSDEIQKDRNRSHSGLLESENIVLYRSPLGQQSNSMQTHCRYLYDVFLHKKQITYAS